MTDPIRLLEGVPRSLPGEQVDDLLTRSNLRIERIVSTGQASAPGFWYDQAEHEWVLVLSGLARLRYQDPDKQVELGPGDALFIPAHTKHRVEWTTPSAPTVWLALFWTEP